MLTLFVILNTLLANSSLTDSSGKAPGQLSFDGEKYDLDSLSKESKSLVRGIQVADAQLRMHEDALKVLALGRQSLARQLQDSLRNEKSN